MKTISKQQAKRAKGDLGRIGSPGRNPTLLMAYCIAYGEGWCRMEDEKGMTGAASVQGPQSEDEDGVPKSNGSASRTHQVAGIQ